MAVPARPVPGAPIESAWGDIAHDTAVAMDIQVGSATITLPASQTSGSLAVTFPRPFASAPTVMVSNQAGTATFLHSAGAPNPAGVTLLVFRRDGTAPGSAQTTTVAWLAYGPRA